MSTTVPATSPPPRTRSKPGKPVLSRSTAAGPTSRRGRTRDGPGGAAAAAARVSSTYVFHSPQSGQRPSHFEDAAPQDWQTKTEVGLGDMCLRESGIGNRESEIGNRGESKRVLSPADF